MNTTHFTDFFTTIMEPHPLEQEQAIVDLFAIGWEPDIISIALGEPTEYIYDVLRRNDEI